MKLLHVVASYLPAVRYGGTIVSVHGLCRALARRGHDVHVYTTSVDGPDNSPVPHGEAVELDGVNVRYFQSRIFRRLYYAPAMRSALRESMTEFAVVHTHAIYLWPLWTAAREARLAGVPYVVSQRGMLEKDLIERKSAIWKSALIGFVEKRNLEGAAAVHVTSRREAQEAPRSGASGRRCRRRRGRCSRRGGPAAARCRRAARRRGATVPSSWADGKMAVFAPDLCGCQGHARFAEN